MDNRGNRLIVTDEAAINTPAVAAAYVTKRYASQATDEISLEVCVSILSTNLKPVNSVYPSFLLSRNVWKALISENLLGFQKRYQK